VRAAPLVGVLEKHGRLYAVRPLFERGARVNVDKPRGHTAVGDLVHVVRHQEARGEGPHAGVFESQRQ